MSNSYSKNPGLMLLVRAIAGVSLILIGAQYVLDETILERVFSNNPLLHSFEWLHAFIPWIFIVGGALILFGLLTRWAAIIQISFLVAAYFFVTPENRLLSAAAGITITIGLIFLLIIIFIKGSDSVFWKNLLVKENKAV